MRRLVAVIAGLAVVLVGFAGVAVALNAAAPQSAKIAKACVNSKKVLSLKQGGSCGAGKSAVTIPTMGGPGQILGYAHINPGGTLDAARSWRVKSANAVSDSAGFWCFTGLPFTPKGAQVTPDYNGLGNGDVATVNVVLPADPGDCGLTSAQIEVFTGLVDTSTFTFTAGTDFGFYVVFY